MRVFTLILYSALVTAFLSYVTLNMFFLNNNNNNNNSGVNNNTCVDLLAWSDPSAYTGQYQCCRRYQLRICLTIPTIQA